jgi:hypothetical protein
LSPTTPRLRIEPPEALEVLVRARAPALEVWRDEDGEIYATGGRVGKTYWIEVLEVGTFRFGGDDGEEVVGTPLPNVADEEILDNYRRIVLSLVLHACGCELVHASAVVAPSGGVVAFAAGTRTGKSTLAYALSLRGHPIWADDAVLFQTGSGTVESTPLPFALRIRQPSARFFDLQARAEGEWRPLFVEGDAARPFAAVGLLEQMSGGTGAGPAVEVELRDPASAFPALLAHSYCFSIKDPRRKRDMMSRYLELTARVPVYDIRFRPPLERLGELLDRIEQTVIPS